MTELISNTAYLEVIEAAPLENVGWTVRVLSERDYASLIAQVDRFVDLGFTVDLAATGGGKITLDSDDPVLTRPLPAGEPARLLEQQALWQFLEDGQVRFEILAEDVEEDVVSADGLRSTVVAGRGTACVLEWAPVLPAGMPTPTSTTRTFNVHPMTAWVTLFEEAQTAGYLTWVTLLFDGAEDSAGLAWGAVQDLTVEAGTNLLSLLERWCEANDLAWEMLPGFRLQVFTEFGHRREAEVVFTQWRSQGEHRRRLTRREVANTIYAAAGTSVIATSTDGTSQDRWRKRARWVTAGDAADISAAQAIATTTLALSKDQKSSRTVRLIPDGDGRRPFVDFGVGDWVTVEVPDDDPESGTVRVVGLAVQIDADGGVEVEATLQSRFEARAIRIQRTLALLGGSSTEGAGATPIPVSQVVSAVRLSDLADVDLTSPSEGSLLQWNGSRWVDVAPNLDLLADVDTGTIPPSGTVALVRDPGDGLWKPTVVAPADAMRWRGAWDDEEDYDPGHVVTHSGSVYVLIGTDGSETPGAGSEWRVLG